MECSGEDPKFIVQIIRVHRFFWFTRSPFRDIMNLKFRSSNLFFGLSKLFCGLDCVCIKLGSFVLDFVLLYLYNIKRGEEWRLKLKTH